MTGKSASSENGGERGASLVEYALLVALIAMVCFAAIIFFGDSARDSFDSTGSSIQSST